MSSTSVEAFADELDDALVHARPVAPLSQRHPGMTLADAYGIQARLVARWTDAGDRVVGHKVGLTSAAMQRQLGVDHPDSGVLTDRMVLTDGAEIDPTRLIAPRVEAEIAVVLGRDVTAGAAREELERSVESVVLALEVIDSRVADWRITLEDSVADNASSAFAVLGWPVPRTELADLRTLGVTVRRNAEVVATGAGAAVLGDPLLALGWLSARQDAPPLQAGQVVLLGAVHAAVPFTPGDVVTATAPGFGSVSARMGLRS